jgi:hypothetical protein
MNSQKVCAGLSFTEMPIENESSAITVASSKLTNDSFPENLKSPFFDLEIDLTEFSFFRTNRPINQQLQSDGNILLMKMM